MVGLFRLYQGRLCCTYSKSRVWQSCHEMGSWERSDGGRLEASPQWKMGFGEWWLRGHWECLSNGIKWVFSGVLSTLWKVQIYHQYWCRLSKMCTFKYLISSGFFFFRFIKLIYCHFFLFWFLILLCNIHKSIKLLFSMCVQRQLRILTSE